MSEKEFSNAVFDLCSKEIKNQKRMNDFWKTEKWQNGIKAEYKRYKEMVKSNKCTWARAVNDVACELYFLY